MYKKILIAVDLAGGAEQVLEAGWELAGLYKATFQAIYCIEPPMMPMGEFVDPMPVVDMVQLKKELIPMFKQVAANIGMNSDLVSVEIGRPVDVIVEMAETVGADLIVVGSHGRHGLKLLLGSTANAVLHHAKCDVLAVRIK